MTLGQVDCYVGHPWASPEEELYPVVTEALRVWSYDQRLRLAKVIIVDESDHGPEATLASLLERNSAAVGGQAGTSSKIRNYLGFPWGVRGGDLAQQAHRQAEQLSAKVVATRSATGLTADGDELRLRLSSGDVVRTRSVILTGGVSYRRTGVPSVDALIGRGVFYGAAAGEATSMGGLRVAVLGGGSSAGQAAAHLAAAGADVTVLVRRDALSHNMSDYLVTQLEGTPAVTIRCQVEVAEALGGAALEALVLRDTATGKTDVLATDAMFVFIGAVPLTDWLDGIVALDEHGFVVTGRDPADWLEISMPRVYAAGDIRSGSIKRVAAAVGEGSTAAMLARAALEERTSLP